jgi:hypothetical protein
MSDELTSAISEAGKTLAGVRARQAEQLRANQDARKSAEAQRRAADKALDDAVHELFKTWTGSPLSIRHTGPCSWELFFVGVVGVGVQLSPDAKSLWLRFDDPNTGRVGRGAISLADGTVTAAMLAEAVRQALDFA